MTDVLTVIGVFLLVVVAIILLLLCQPVRYRLEGQRYEGWQVQFHIDYAWQLLSLEVRYAGGAGLYWQVAVPFFQRDSQSSAGGTKKKEFSTDTATVSESEMPSNASAVSHSNASVDADKEIPPETGGDIAEECDDTTTPAEDTSDKQKKTPVSVYIRTARYAISEGIIGTIGTFLCRIWKRTRPKWAKGDLDIGMADAYQQGLISGGLYATFPELASRIHWNYIEEIYEGRVALGGAIRPIGVLWDGLRFLVAPAVRKTAVYYIKQVKQTKEATT